MQNYSHNHDSIILEYCTMKYNNKQKVMFNHVSRDIDKQFISDT